MNVKRSTRRESVPASYLYAGRLGSGAAFLVSAGLLVGCGTTTYEYVDGGSSSNGGSNGGSGGSSGGSGGSSGGSGGSSGTSGSGGSSSGGSGGSNSSSGTAPPPEMPPPTTCQPSAMEGPVTQLDFSNNLIASPAPPGNLTPQNAPQIVVYGFDDIENQPGMQFVTDLLGSLQNPATNPNSGSSNAAANLNPNACYSYQDTYQCGDGSLGSNLSLVTNLVSSRGFAIASHTMDHLEGYEPNNGWSGIPACWHNLTMDPAGDPPPGGWFPCGSDTCNNGSPSTNGPAATAGTGPGGCMDQATWASILPANDAALKTDYSVPSVTGFRAPRLEMNDQGLQAVKAMGYAYDVSLEEIQPPGWVNAAVDADTDSMKGFAWFPWPYTLDNGSPGNWNQQINGDKAWVTNFPTGLWELPVYEVYIPSKNGLGKTIANRMLMEDVVGTACTPPAGTMTNHCFLSDGELSPGDAETEVTGFDFNTFVYCRMQPDEWLTTMKHTFLLRYYGSRAPLTYGAHPIEYSSVYDSYTLETQGNNWGYRDVVKFNTYDQRQMAMTQFVQWITSDPVLSKDTFFMSFKDLVDYMQKPFDKTGAAVQPDTVAMPDSNALFTKLGWTTQGAKISSTSGNAATITFTIPVPASGDPPAVSYAAAGLAAGALKDVSHIDIKYSTEVPFRIRLLTNDGSPSVTALLAGVGGDRLARIRVKDFFPGPEAGESQVAGAALVDSAYMAKVNGIAFESAATMVAPSGAPGTFPGGDFKTTIEQVTLHGVATSSLCQ